MLRTVLLILALSLLITGAHAEIKTAGDVFITGEGYCFNSASSLIRDEVGKFKKGDYIAIIADGETLDVVNSVLKLEGYRIVEKSPLKEKTRFVIEVR